MQNKSNGHQCIGCKVESCAFNNCENCTCTLSSIEVKSCKGCDSCKPEDTACASFKANN